MPPPVHVTVWGEPLAAMDVPKLVLVGGWEAAPAGSRPSMAAVMRAVAARVADRIGARLVTVPGAAHEPQRERPEVVNDLLDRLWSGSGVS